MQRRSSIHISYILNSCDPFDLFDFNSVKSWKVVR